MAHRPLSFVCTALVAVHHASHVDQREHANSRVRAVHRLVGVGAVYDSDHVGTEQRAFRDVCD